MSVLLRTDLRCNAPLPPGNEAISEAETKTVRCLELGQVAENIDQVTQVPAEPVEFPHDQGVAVTQGSEAGGQLGPVSLDKHGIWSSAWRDQLDRFGTLSVRELDVLPLTNCKWVGLIQAS